MLDNLSSKLQNAVKVISGQSKITQSNIQEAIREVRIALLEADVAIGVVKKLIEEIKKEALGQKVIGSLKPGETFIGVVYDKLVELMGGFNDKLNLNTTPPAVILMAGLQGAGKTTTTGKLAKRLKEQDKKKVLVVSTDVYRPAAIQQLEVLSSGLDVECYPSDINQKPLDIAKNAINYAKKYYFDVLIIDTAGRLAVDDYMMNEIKSLQEGVLPVETLFVVDAMLGQDAVNTAKVFNDVLNLTGIVLTKMDGDTRGGAALSIREITGKPIKFIGVSEKSNGLEPFYPDRLASRILGKGDILSLIEEVKSSVNEADAKKMVEKVKRGKKFDLEDFKQQFKQLDNMGGLGKIMDKMPTEIALKTPSIINDKMIKKYSAIIDSMTPKERREPDILKASRKKRIASGSGTTVQDINQLLKQFEQINQMVKKFGNGGMMKMLNSLKHLLPR